MDRFFYLSTIFCSCFFLFLIYSGDAILLSRVKRGSYDWGYAGPNGPHFWKGACNTGKYQSPINIVTKNAREESFTPFHFGKNYETVLNYEAVNNGHTLLVSTTNSTALPTFQGGGLDGKFVFQQLHFHWESEHEIDGQRAALEMHLVHYNSKYKDIGIASLEEDGLAVIAVLCDESKESDSVLDDFIQKSLSNALYRQNIEANASRESSEEEEGSKVKQVEEKYKLNYSLRDLLPANTDRWFRYRGSLTTPYCDETVTWTIFLDRLQVSSKSLSTFRSLHDGKGNYLNKNYRPIQDINGRIIYLQVDESYNEVNPKGKGGSSSIIPNFIVIFVIFSLNLLKL